MDTLPVYLYNEEINKLLIDYYILCNSKQLINTEQLVAKSSNLVKQHRNFYLRSIGAELITAKEFYLLPKGSVIDPILITVT